MPNLYLPVSAFILSSIILVIYFCRRRLNLLENKLYSLMLISIFFDSLLVSSLFFNVYTGYNENLVMLLNRLDYFALIIWSTSLFLYMFTITYNKTDNFNKKFRKALLSTSVIDVIMFLVVYYSKIEIVLIDTLHQTAQGDAVNISIVFCLLYIISSLLLVLINHKQITTKHFPIFVIIITAIVIACLFSINPFLICISMGLTIDNLIMYFTIENPDMKMLDEYHKAKEIAEKSNDEKAMFLLNVSQEIKQPAENITHLAKDLIEDSNELNAEYIKKYGDAIKNQSDEIINIVNTSLDINSNDIKLINSKYNPKLLFTQVLKALQLNEIKLQKDIDDTIPEQLYGDSIRIKEVLKIILNNSIKYTEKGYINFTAKNIIKNNVCRLIITIEDSGSGIEAEKIKEIFEDNTFDDERNNLVKAKKIVERIGGIITVTSDLAKGSKFTIVLDQKITEENDTLKKLDIKYMDKKSVLIVDYDKENVKKLTRYLKKYNCEIVSVDTSVDCLNKIRNNEKYNLIFIREDMPKLTGDDIIFKLNQIRGFKIPIVMLIKTNKNTKYDEYVVTPIKKDLLYSTVDDYLN